MVFLFWVAVAAATDASVHELACPYGTGKVKVYEVTGTNTAGGFDSDLARYAAQGQFRTYAMSTCPATMFSLYGEDMKDTIDPKDDAAIAKALASVLAGLPDRVNPPVWDRYAIGAAMYRAIGTPAEQVGDVYLEASWTARDEAVGVYIGLQGPKGADEELAKGKAMVDTVTGAPRRTLLFNLARVAERAGYPDTRDRYLALFEREPLEPAEKAALARFRTAVQIEPRFQDLAIAEYRKALTGHHLAGADEARVQYLLADLLRRRGQTTEARTLFSKVAARTDTPAELSEMAGYLATTANPG